MKIPYSHILNIIFIACLTALSVIVFHENGHVEIARAEGIGVKEICYLGWLNGTNTMGWVLPISKSETNAHIEFDRAWGAD